MLSPTLRRAALALGLLLGTAACSDSGSAPTAPEGAGTSNPPAIPAEAIPLTIDVRTGDVRVGRDRPDRADHGLAYSMLGDDVVAVEAEACTFSPVPGSNKLIRCSFGIRITNLLSRTELVTPTTFPRPPAGVEGVLVFPLLTGAIGSPGGTAVPSPDWDGDPVNFFNDFAGCGRGADDCYRWERFDAPLAPGIPSERRVVGFDVPKSAQAVGVYLVVAADLRDDPEYSVALDPVPALSGEVAAPSAQIRQLDVMRVGRFDLAPGLAIPLLDDLRAVMAFDLSGIPATATIRSATLRVPIQSVHNGPLSGTGVIEHIDVGDALTLGAHGAPALGNVGSLTPSGPGAGFTFDAAARVQAALDGGFATAAFRVRWATGASEEQWFGLRRVAGGASPAPQLEVVYGYD